MRRYGAKVHELDDLWLGLLEIMVRRKIVERFDPRIGASWASYLHRVVKNYFLSYRASRMTKQCGTERSLYTLDPKTGRIDPIPIASSVQVEKTVVDRETLQGFRSYLQAKDKKTNRTLLIEDVQGQLVPVNDGPSGVLKVLEIGHPMSDVADVMGISQAMATYRRKQVAFLAQEYLRES